MSVASFDWGEGAFERSKMRPMPEPSWESLLALPDDTEVLAIFVLPLGVGLRGVQFPMNPANRRGVEAMRDDRSAQLPTYVTYVLPEIEIPDPEAFFATDNPRKDADK